MVTTIAGDGCLPKAVEKLDPRKRGQKTITEQDDRGVTFSMGSCKR